MDGWDAVSSRMAERRKQLGLSYQALAERTGLTKSTLQRYEKGNIRNAPHRQAGRPVQGLGDVRGGADGTTGKERF